MLCPHCHQDIDDKLIAAHLAHKGGQIGGKSTSAAKRAAAQANGKKGGRPKLIRGNVTD